MSANVIEYSQPLEQRDLEQFVGKKIGYYVGSFDPVHEGHRAVVEQLFTNDQVDYVLVYPAPGGDVYKNRSHFALRQQMLETVFKVNARVILTRTSPAEIQKMLSPYFGKIEFIGIIGSDVLRDHLTNPDEAMRQKMLSVYMRGVTIPAKHANTTIGAIMAIPVTSFIVSIREGDNADYAKGHLEDRPLSGINIHKTTGEISSTKIKKALQLGETTEGVLDAGVRMIIDENKLYSITMSK